MALQDLGQRASLANNGSTGHTGWRLLLTQVHSNSALVSGGNAATLPGLQVKAMPAAYMHTVQDKASLEPTQLVIVMAAEQPAPAPSHHTLLPQLEDIGASHRAGGVNEAARNQIDGRRRERGKEGIHASTTKPRPADSRSRNEGDRDRDRDRHRDRGRDSRWGTAGVLLLWHSSLSGYWLVQGIGP